MPDSILNGLIVERGSPLVQFEIQRPSRGVVADTKWKFPFIVWVNRIPERKKAVLYPCQCSSIVWKVSRSGLPRKLLDIYQPGLSCVCPCMGRFIE
jgi:hypothetical protein